ncbi:ABC transporter ATP-binding protein [Pseudoflavonifractor sp. An85]|uniref:metal ABC transporter ATP-binding protein n=1 Tax=Pseudoflavonifractor sp. An85 TaxID=1965661 RepID=UPI000B3A03E5|nr:ABC transporter ATP-binding protein [Pseudoflavonifractor sp. An85]OUN25547.1 ABC transporter [Pseudoflavonifractor sp. An85]
MALVTCKDVALGYQKTVLVQGLNLEVNRGDYWCIIGDNGVGKSTFVRTLLGLQPTLAGRITLGEGLSSCDLGYLPQQTLVQRDFPATVEEIVRSGCVSSMGWRPRLSRKELARVEENLERMGIAHLAGRSYRTLSGGQQQRVRLARALCGADTLLLLDEPVAGLDPEGTAEMYALVDRLNRDGMTILMVSHDLEGVQAHATHVLRMAREPKVYSLREGGALSWRN